MSWSGHRLANTHRTKESWDVIPVWDGSAWCCPMKLDSGRQATLLPHHVGPLPKGPSPCPRLHLYSRCSIHRHAFSYCTWFSWSRPLTGGQPSAASLLGTPKRPHAASAPWPRQPITGIRSRTNTAMWFWPSGASLPSSPQPQQKAAF